MDDLPDELILEILTYLPGIDLDHYQLETLRSLSLTNKRFHRIVTANLFSTYDSHFCDPYLFLRTMISNPQLAACVKEVKISYRGTVPRNGLRTLANAQDKKIIKEGMRALGIPAWKSWAADCNAQNADNDVIPSAILMLTCNVESLAVQESWFEQRAEPSWIELLRRASTGTNPGRVHQFEHLQSVQVNANRLKLTQLAPLFRLQSIRQLHIKDPYNHDLINARSLTALQRALPACCSNLEEFHLEQACLNMDVLGVLLAAPRALKDFKYEIWAENVPQVLSAQHVMGTLRLPAALKHQKESLESLCITLDPLAEAQVPRSVCLVESIAGFAQLQQVECSMCVLLDVAQMTVAVPIVKALPTSIRTLRILANGSWNSKDRASALLQIATDGPTMLPSLKRVCVRLASGCGGPDNYDWEVEMRAFSATSTAFVVEREDELDWEFGDAQWARGTIMSSSSSSSEEEVDLYSDGEG